ncbi:MAG: CHAT domain-containing protein [Gemmataceae bacterium]|nr:CHAT domain-containing protein [Gemmataceae bacterium]
MLFPRETDTEKSQVEKLLNQRKQIEKRLAEFANAATQRLRRDSKAIQQQLPADAAIVFWLDLAAVGGNIQEHWGCVFRKNEPIRWVRLPASAAKPNWDMEARRVPQQYRQAVLEAAPTERRNALQRHFLEQRVDPIKESLKGVKSIQFLATSELAGVPLDPMFSDYAVSYLPAASWLSAPASQYSMQPTSFFAIGDPAYPSVRLAVDSKNWPKHGVTIKQVLPDGAAARVGLRTGDVLLDYAKEPINSHEELVTSIKKHSTNPTNSVRYWRDGQTHTIDVTSGKIGVGVEDIPATQSLALQESLAKLNRGGDWDELPGTAAELASLQSLFPQSTVLTRKEASPTKLAELVKADKLKDYRYLHFATHGEANSVMAFQSSLILHGDDKSVARLTAREILDTWKLNAELVTLSACETAIGKDGGGDGLLGFAQAFLTAGARSVCLSLWKVDDAATALLMERFYQNLLGKRDGLAKPMAKADALREAKQWLRNLSTEDATVRLAKISQGVARGARGKNVDLKVVATETKDAKPFAHPKYWAAFILIGDPN